jgi:hypothetical protein
MGAWRQDGLADSYVGHNVTLTNNFFILQIQSWGFEE